MAAPSLATEVSGVGGHPSNRFSQRERKLLESVKTYVDSISADTVITTQGDIIIGDGSGNATRLAKGSSGLPLVAGASTVSYAALAAGGLATDAVETAKIKDLNVTTDKLAADAVTNAKIADTAISLEHLDSGIAPSHVVKYAGTFTTAGGDDTETITVTGAAATDLVFVQLWEKGATPRTILTAVPSTDTITVVFSGDPSTDHKLYYQVVRAAS